MAKKYRVIGSFTYRGEDGHSDKSVIIGPGEEVPKLDANEKERLLRLGRICEVSESGENIVHKNPEDFNETQINNLMKKNPNFIASFLTSRQNSKFPLSKETLSKMYTIAEGKKMPANLLEKIEGFLV